jgi:co-chaperonin GroES (HSP10)
MVALFEPIKVNAIRPVKNHVIVCDMNFDQRTSLGGIVLLSDNGKLEGVHPRWGRVYAVGPDQKDVQVGQWICVKHGRWTRGLEIEDATGEKTIRRIDNEDILLVSDDPMQDEVIGDNMGVSQKSRD